MSINWLDLISQWIDDDDFEDVSDEIGKMIPVVSSNLAAVRYDPGRYVLYIAFLDGTVYRYEGVPDDEYKGLLSADSHGEYFVDNIREVYPYERIIG